MKTAGEAVGTDRQQYDSRACIRSIAIWSKLWDGFTESRPFFIVKAPSRCFMKGPPIHMQFLKIHS